MTRMTKSTATVLLVLGALLTLSCAKKSGGGAGSGEPSPASGDTPVPAGAVAIETEPEAKPTLPGKKDGGEDDGDGDGDDLPIDAPETFAMSQQIALRPVIGVGTVAIDLTLPTELERFEESKYVWNPANVPLEELNKIVCVLAKTGFHHFKNKGRFIAKVPLQDCFKMAGGTKDAEDASPAAPADVLVETAAHDKVIDVKVWFSREMKNGMGTAATMDVFISEPFTKIDLDYFVEASIAELATNANPFGVFSMKWEMLLTKDGTRDTKPFQQGYLTTAKADGKATLQYNQMNYNYDAQKCPALATATHAGVPFIAQASGTTLNGETITFDGTQDVAAAIAASGRNAIIDQQGLRSMVLPAMTLVLMGGTKTPFPSAAHASYQGIDFATNAMTDKFNGYELVFDGTKTIGDVVDAARSNDLLDLNVFADAYGMILPAGTATFSGGINEAPATVTVATPDGNVLINASDSGTELNGFRICFDGVKSVADTLSDLVLPIKSTHLIVPSSGERKPPKGCVTMSGGVGPPRDTWATIREFAAAAQMDHVEGKPVRGKAHTAENWTRQNVTNICAKRAPSWSPMPTSYGMVFDKFDAYPGKVLPPSPANRMPYPGRSVSRQFNGYLSANMANGYDPRAPRCEQMGGETANVWGYALFSDKGQKINHKTYLPLFVDGSTSAWGDGSVSEWGTYLWAPNADRAYIKNKDGSKRYFDVVKLDGVLFDINRSAKTFDQSTGTERYTCKSMCPAGTIDQEMLNHRYDASYFLYGQDYVYDYATKQLYRDIDKDGGKDEVVQLDAGVQGSFDVTLTLKTDAMKFFTYYIDSYNAPIALKEGSAFFTPPKRLRLDKAMAYDPALHAYPGTEILNAAHDGETFADMMDQGDLTFDYGSICCLKWEEKAGVLDQWGNKSFSPAVTFKKGAPLRLDAASGDPDGNGPLTAAMPVLVAPAFTELRPKVMNDCSSDSLSQLSGLQAAMPLPEPLSDVTLRKVSQHIGERPAGPYPVLTSNGEPL